MMSAMSDLTRRDFGAALAAFAALASVEEAQGASDVLSSSKLYRYDDLPVHKGATGVESRAVLHGTLPTGEVVEVHETMLPPGQAPHPPHRHRHSEMTMVREGKLEFFNDGKTEEAGPGDVILYASMVLHGIKNIGTTDAKYFVIAIGAEAPAK
jgi:quercetin dioxygenase-like cupin family protein